MKFKITVHEIRCASGYLEVEAETMNGAFLKAQAMVDEGKVVFDESSVYPSGDYEYECDDAEGVTHIYDPAEDEALAVLQAVRDISKIPGAGN